MLFKRISSIIITAAMLLAAFALFATAEENEAVVFHVDSLNGTRWEDYLCVYRGLEHTGQNEWGENVVVNADGIVTEKIAGADIRGKNLPIPEGGMVVSGTGDIGKKMFDSSDIGDRCLFDEYTMRVYFSKGEIDPFYKQSIRVTGYNSVRWSDTVIIYNKSGERTGTNVFGYEVCVDKDGYIVSAGGNDNTVLEGGYVISVTEQEDIATLEMYFVVGAKCRLYDDRVDVQYTKNELARTAESELNALKAKLEDVKKQYRLIDYSAIEAAIGKIEIGSIETLEERNAVISEIHSVEPMFYESRSVETRSVWYTSEETSASAIKEEVAEMKAAGINELVLASNSSKGTIIPIDTKEIPFRRDPIVRRLDILQTYIDECRANGISIVVLVPVMGGSFGENHPEWFDVTNTGVEREDIFFSPANDEYRKAFTDYVKYIITNYDVDGLQLDYIRYPQFYDGVDAGYDDATVKLFEEKTGNGREVVEQIGKQLYNHPKWNEWWSFKTELINSWVEEIYGIASTLRPDIYVTAAVAASDGVGYYCQDPDAWIEGGYIDGIYVMSYAEEINEATTNPHTETRGDRSYLVMGCGAYLSISNRSLIAQTDNSAALGADGTGYFEWGAVRNHRYTEIFKDSLFKNSAIPFTASADEVAKRLSETARARIALYCETADGETASVLVKIASDLQNESIDVAALNDAISGISALLDGDDEKYLTADLKTAVRALNMQKADFEFVKPSTEASSVESGIESESENTADSSSAEAEAQEGTSLPIIIAVISALAVIAVAVLVVIKRKK